MPPVDLSTSTQIVKGAILTCATTSSTPTTTLCGGLKLNGLDVRLAVAEANLVCNVITGAEFSSGMGTGTVAQSFHWNGSNWGIVSATVTPMQNLNCNL